MLSRIAESMFWIGRYVERAEDTARILDVQTQMLFEDTPGQEEALCRNLLSIMGIAPAEGECVDTAMMMQHLVHDVGAPTSVASVLGAARESARRARETLSEPMWEALNAAHRVVVSGQLRRMPLSAVFAWVRDRSALINGAAEATMTRDEGWQFFVLGRSIERADMTSRLVATASFAGGVGSPWTSIMRACGGHEAFLRTYKGLETDRGAAEFLLLDRLFPRSVVFSLSLAEQCLDNLETGQRVGFQNDAHRLVGRTRADLEYRPLADVTADLPSEMERLQLTCARATEAIARRYFSGSEGTYWAGGRV